MKTLTHIAILCAVCVAVSLPAQGQKRRRKPAPAWGVPSVYSNMFLEGETGDVGGMEVVIIPSSSGEWATVVIASGIDYDPVLVRVKRDGAKIEFTLPDSGDYKGYGTFVGHVTKAGLVLRNGQDKQVLKRQCSTDYR